MSGSTPAAARDRLQACVVLCTYNGEAFLRGQLDSLLSQTRLPDRIAIADDASHDGTWDLLVAFAARATGLGIGVDLVRNPANLGYARNFSDTLERSRGDVVFLSDQDDVWHSDRIEAMLAEFRRRPALALLHTDARLVDGGGRPLGHGLFDALDVTRAELRRIHQGGAFEVLLRRNLVTGATAAFRRECIADLLPVPEGWPHDEWLALGVALRGEVDCLEWASIDYRQHGGNQIGVRRRSLAEKATGAGRPGKRDYMRQQLARLHALQAWAATHGATLPAGRARDIEHRIAHVRFRATLPDASVARMAAVAKEALRGRYARYSAGMRSVLSDALGLD